MPVKTRRQVTAPASRFFKPRLHPQQVLHLHILHELLLGDLLSGKATVDTVWEVAAMALTWSRTAELLGVGEPEIAPQLELATRLVERWAATGQVALVSAERDVARRGTVVMDLLAQQTDQATATAASHWSEGCLNVMRAQMRTAKSPMRQEVIGAAAA